MAYRTHVLYDFSIVSKAKFYVFEEDTSIFGKGINYKRADGEFKDPLPVQINPDEFDVTYGSTVKSIGPIENSILNDREDLPGGIPLIKPQEGRSDLEEIEINLKYDIYDEYNVRTMDGTVPTADFSLESETHTSLKRLGKIASSGGRYYVLFVWGNIEHFGLISSVNVNYTAFSRWGHPLKADVTVKIVEQPLGYDKYGAQEKPTESGKLGVKSAIDITLSSKLEKTKLAAQVSALAASQALR